MLNITIIRIKIRNNKENNAYVDTPKGSGHLCVVDNLLMTNYSGMIWGVTYLISVLNLGLRPANERRCYFVTTSPIV